MISPEALRSVVGPLSESVLGAIERRRCWRRQRLAGMRRHGHNCLAVCCDLAARCNRPLQRFVGRQTVVDQKKPAHVDERHSSPLPTIPPHPNSRYSPPKSSN